MCPNRMLWLVKIISDGMYTLCYDHTISEFVISRELGNVCQFRHNLNFNSLPSSYHVGKLWQQRTQIKFKNSWNHVWLSLFNLFSFHSVFLTWSSVLFSWKCYHHLTFNVSKNTNYYFTASQVNPLIPLIGEWVTFITSMNIRDRCVHSACQLNELFHKTVHAQSGSLIMSRRCSDKVLFFFLHCAHQSVDALMTIPRNLMSCAL